MVRPKTIDSEIQNYLIALENKGFEVQKAVLFGSVAKGTSNEYSDIDLAVWSKQFSSNYFENIERTASLKRNFLKIELHPFSLDETSNNNPFIEEIENTGIIIKKLVTH